MPTRPRARRPPDARPCAAERGYDHRWQQARLSFLAEHPLCVDCTAEGKVTEATEVDHVTPHRGDQALFWSRDNWAARCKPHHSAKTARGE